MRKIVNILLALILSVFTGGCRSTSWCESEANVPVVCESPKMSQVSGTEMDLDNMEKVKTSPRLKAYPIGRYVDPNNPDVMHEGHVIYRQEAPASWNRNPNAPTAVPLGPTVAISHPERFQEPLSAEFEISIKRSNQYMKSVMDQNQAILNLVEKLKDEVNKLKQER